MFFILYLSIHKRNTMADWDSMGRSLTKTRGRALQTLGRAF